jgi:signal transduction histidine kinase
MTALELISTINQALFVGLFVAVLLHALRRRSRSSVNTALLFGSIAAVVGLSRVAPWLGLSGLPWYTGAVLALVSLAPLAMLRLVDDFSGTPGWVQPTGIAAFAGVSVLGLTTTGQPEVVELAALAFFVAVGGYAALAFAREARRTRGITRRRMTAVAIGAVLFIGAIVVLLVGALLGGGGDLLAALVQLGVLIAAVAFFLGFATPAWVRRAWREPDLRRFLERSIHLAGVPDDRLAVAELQQAAATAFGASGASIGLADPDRGLLRYVDAGGAWVEEPDDAFLAGRAFREQRRIFAPDAESADPERAEDYRRAGARTVIAAPITTEDRRIGVLTIYADRAPIFVEDDLWLLELLADQAAVLLEARTLTAHASELRAREDAALLKEEFLSAAAHDLRTPLTVVLGQAELIERRVARDPNAPIDAAGVARLAREARRLGDLVSELLDAQRLEQPGVLVDPSPGDLCDVVEEVRARHAERGVHVTTQEPSEPLVASIDRARIEQVLNNLVENAIKYTPNGRPPTIRARAAGGEALIEVVDQGIGIPEPDRPRVFDRFYRGSNAHGITDTGLGLGLYICRRVVESHGGRIWADGTAGGGSTISVALPLIAALDSSAASQADGPWVATDRSEAGADA